MRIDRYISNSRIIDLSSRDLGSAYSELLDTFGTQLETAASRKKVLKELVEREKSLTSYIGEGVALPHARVSMKRPYALAVGRCPAGLTFEGRDSYEDIRFVFLLLANEKAKNYLSFLAALARAFQDSSIMDQLWMAREKNEFKSVVRNAFADTDDRPARRRTKFNKLLTDEAAKIAKAADCSTILVFTDVFPPTLAPRMTFPNFKVVLAGEGVSDDDRTHHRAHATLAVRLFHGPGFPNFGLPFFLALLGKFSDFRIGSVASEAFLKAVNWIRFLWSTWMRNSNLSSDRVTRCFPMALRQIL